MIRRLDEKTQEEFDQRVRKFRNRTRIDPRNLYDVITGRRFESDTSNVFTNWVEKIPYDKETSAIVKAPKMFSNLRYNIQIAMFKSFGRQGFEYAGTKKRISHEKRKLEELREKGCNVPELIYTSVDNVLVTEYLEGVNCNATVKTVYRWKALKKATKSLKEIHQHTYHGDPSIINTRLVDDEVYWLDFEFLMQEPKNSEERKKLLAQELAYFMFSAINHIRKGYPKINIVDIVDTIFDTYIENSDDIEIVKLAPEYTITNPIFTKIVHFMNSSTAKTIKEIMTKEV